MVPGAAAEVPHVGASLEAGRRVGGDGGGVGARGAHDRARRAQFPEGGRRGDGDRGAVAATAMVAVDAHRFEQAGLPSTGRPHRRRRHRVASIVVCEQTASVGVWQPGGHRVPALVRERRPARTPRAERLPARGPAPSRSRRSARRSPPPCPQGRAGAVSTARRRPTRHRTAAPGTRRRTALRCRLLPAAGRRALPGSRRRASVGPAPRRVQLPARSPVATARDRPTARRRESVPRGSMCAPPRPSPLRRTANTSPDPRGAAASAPRRAATPAARPPPRSAHQLPACSTRSSVHAGDRVPGVAHQLDHLVGVGLVARLQDQLDAGLGDGDVDALAVV